MKPTLLFAIALLLLSGSPGTASSVETAEPVIRFEGMIHDFGEIPSDKKVQFEWEYHNDGQAPLQITGIRPQCGCTVTLADHKMIPPGGSSVLKITFDPAGLNGSVRKSLAVTTNASSNNRVLLALQASVIPVEVAVEEGAHPPIAGQSLLFGNCAGCHSTPAGQLKGKELFVAICAMCHGNDGGGVRAPSIRNLDYLATHTDEELEMMVAYGSANPKMPGFSTVMGGPLSENQVDSLVKLIRSWGALSAEDTP